MLNANVDTDSYSKNTEICNSGVGYLLKDVLHLAVGMRSFKKSINPLKGHRVE